MTSVLRLFRDYMYICKYIHTNTHIHFLCVFFVFCFIWLSSLFSQSSDLWAAQAFSLKDVFGANKATTHHARVRTYDIYICTSMYVRIYINTSVSYLCKFMCLSFWLFKQLFLSKSLRLFRCTECIHTRTHTHIYVYKYLQVCV